MLPRPMKPIWSPWFTAPRTRRRPGLPAGGRRCRRDDAVQPGVFRRGGFERDGDAEIILGRIDGFAAVEPVHHRGRAVAHAAIGHADRRAVVGFQHQPHIQRGRAVRAHDDPVGAAGQHLAASAARPRTCRRRPGRCGGCPSAWRRSAACRPPASVMVNRGAVRISAMLSSRAIGRRGSDPIRQGETREWRSGSGDRLVSFSATYPPNAAAPRRPGGCAGLHR